ncbi:NHLP bacteriocin export ABC transporter permease/ATPase subunit [Nodosilinea sp. LEGE 07088]|uniref:NHLP bacteriocin export ABC transporter permease/ATPase subunit n=1 Tax=Nodosilinea sp. LEGE 07088 TaxID=2777968 RepID=UPI00187F64D2|nr:NHLP bacteriocin export ABC transporter permease/ATPase subunit [Nodosilinea sp. LEGE 07088]MBE9138847.1 NHLP bacteriocin export ABC transporter permease/ATPase subunit [Nodosilinea sp. LEGE 07088]
MAIALATQPLGGTVQHIQGNEPLLLDDPRTVWVVQSGAIAVFALPLIESAGCGRRYLFTVEPGQALFGYAPSATSAYQLLAVAMGEAEIIKIEPPRFDQLFAHQKPLTIDWIDAWVQQLATLIPPPRKAVEPTDIDSSAQQSLVSGQVYSPPPEGVTWLVIQQGTARWLGMEDLILKAGSSLYPLWEGMQIVAQGPVQLKGKPTASLSNPEQVRDGLATLHTWVLHYLQFIAQKDLDDEGRRLQAQAQLNQQMTQEAFQSLASTLGSQTHEVLASEPLLMAMGAVGKALGVAISPPSQSTDSRQDRDPIEAIARASRLRMRQVQLRGDWWEKDCGPLLGFTQQDDKPLALLPVGATRYVIFNPEQRSYTPLHGEAAPEIASVAFTFYRPLPDRALKAVDVVRFALKGRGRDLVTILVTGMLVTALGMLTPQATAILMDNAIPDGDRTLLFQVGLGLLVAAIGTTLFRLTQGLALLRLETLSDAVTQSAVWNRLLTLPVSFFRQYATGDLQSRVTSISTIRRQLGGNTLMSLLGSLFACLNLVLLLFYSAKLALIAVVAALLAALVTAGSGILLIRKVRPLLELQGSIFGHTVQLINGISKLRVAGAEERAFATWSKRYSQQVKLDLSTEHIEDAVELFNTLMPTLTSAALFWFTVQLLSEAQTNQGVGLSVGTFLAFNSAFGTFIGGATGLSNTLTGTLQVLPQWKRAQPILETVPEVDLTKADPGRLQGQIAVDHVVFRYGNDGPLILSDVSLEANPGEFIALVGGSGSGKSTLLRLILGFEKPESGTIFFDGQDLSGLDLDAVRRQMGVVLQTGHIMSGSLFENLSGGARITLEEAWEAAHMSGLADDISAMPMGMHTVVSEGGGNLSGGQRQRLLIARALVLKPRILLFDEATSALDNRTQAIVSESLDRLEVTRIVIAHRLSTIRSADRIYVLNAGRLIQKGTYSELSTQVGLFAKLMARQIA